MTQLFGSALKRGAFCFIFIPKYALMKTRTTLFFSFLFSGISIAQSSIELSEIMKGDDFIGHQPSSQEWSQDGQYILFDWNPNSEPGDSRYTYTLKSKEITKVNPEFYSRQYTYNSEIKDVFLRNGNIYFYADGKCQPLLTSTERAYNLQEADHYYFEMGDGLYRLKKECFSVEQVIAFSSKSESKEKEKDHLTKQEYELFQVIRDNEEARKFRNDQRDYFYPSIPVVYTEGKRYSNIQVSPKGKYVFYRIDEYPNDPNTEVPHFISEDGQTYSQKARSKVSANDPNHSLFIYKRDKDTSVQLDLSILSDIRKKPAYMALYGEEEKEFEKDRNIIMHSVKFNPSGTHGVFDIRSYDNKDRWIVVIDLQTLKLKEIDHQHDEAWIGGPGISNWNMVEGTLGWLNDETVFYQSEETGYSHLYTQDLNGNNRKQLTSGNWEVHEVQLSKTKSKFYITANKNHPGNREFYHLDLKTGKLIPILDRDGAVEVSISPDEKHLAVRYSTKNTPWDLYIAENKPGTSLQRITKSTSVEFDKHHWYAPKVVTFLAEDGSYIYAREYMPEPSVKNNAAIIFVHGAGYLQNAHNYWSGYHREYMFHNLLRENGYTVLDIDYRASKGYGRDHRTAIYRHMGGKDLSDQLDGKKYLVEELGIDADRVGIYGGSYGGFITLMALLTEPGEFACGAALRSVTDWNHYNHEYTSNILNYPTTDSIAYYQSSPINFAENLQDRLIMLHGMVDDNVQFQDVVRLSQRFIELGKKDWELAVFPVEAHGFKRADSWTDEYRRILEMFNEELLTK